MRTLFIFALLALASCATESEAPSVDTEKEAQEIRARWDNFITHWENKDSAGCATFYTENASHIAPNSDINKGREAIGSFYETLFLDHAASEYTHTIDQIDIGHNLAVEQGNFSVIWTRGDSSQWSFAARSLTHWVRQDDEWMIEQFMFNLPKR